MMLNQISAVHGCAQMSHLTTGLQAWQAFRSLLLRKLTAPDLVLCITRKIQSPLCCESDQWFFCGELGLFLPFYGNVLNNVFSVVHRQVLVQGADTGTCLLCLMPWENHNCWLNLGLKWAQEMLVSSEKMLQETECSQVCALTRRPSGSHRASTLWIRAKQRKLCQVFLSSGLGIIFDCLLGHCSWSLTLPLAYAEYLPCGRPRPSSWRSHSGHGSQPCSVLLLIYSLRLGIPFCPSLQMMILVISSSWEEPGSSCDHL